METKEHENIKQSKPQQGLSVSDSLDANNVEQVRRFSIECGVTETDIRQAEAIVGSSKSMIKGYLKSHEDTSTHDTSYTGTHW